MIKIIVFDLDGVIADAKEIHYTALNKALEKINSSFCISRDEHLSTYDGLTTKEKLKLLSLNKKLPESFYSEIWFNKQLETRKIINNSFKRDEKLINLFSLLKEKYRLYIASNSTRETVELILKKKEIFHFFEKMFSNEDVVNSKPSAEIYFKCMIDANVSPFETIILEDSIIGRKAALNSGAFLCPINSIDDVNIEYVTKFIDTVNKANGKNISMKWKDPNLNILIPMAGAGSRFEKAGYTFPKPLIDVKGKPMIQLVVESLNIEANYIFIVQEQHYKKFNLKETLNLIAPNCKIILCNGMTEGAACTTLLAKDYLTDGPLLIANSDQLIEWDSSDFMYSMIADKIDGGILVFESTHPKWSFVKLNNSGFVHEVAEKRPISNLATVGIYFWKSGKDYIKYAEQMINKNIRTNNEFYVCPVFNEAISDNKKIKIKKIDESKMWGLGTPEDLMYFLNNYDTNFS